MRTGELAVVCFLVAAVTAFLTVTLIAGLS